MNDLDARFNRRLAWLVAGSLLIFVVVTVFRVGINALPYNAPDSAGHPAGFNDRLYAEHYLLMVRNFHLARFCNREFVYEWVLLATHLVGMGLLLAGARVPSRLARWFFALQALIFPWGLPLLLPLLLAVPVFLFNGFYTDREGWDDNPAILILAAPPWVWVAMFVAWKLRGEELGLKRLAGRLLPGRGRPSPAKKKPPGAGGTEGFEHLAAAAQSSLSA